MQMPLLGTIDVDFDTIGRLDQIFFIWQILQKKWVYTGTAYQLFIDFKKAYSSVRR
jgi:hypothetical protein